MLKRIIRSAIKIPRPFAGFKRAMWQIARPFKIKTYQKYSHREFQEKNYVSGRQAGFENTNKTKALSDAAIRGRIESLSTARVVYILDGDTLIAAQGWRKIRIRLDSIDCPEDGQYWGDIAKYGLIKLIGRRTVYLEEHGSDGHGRILATIYIKHDSKDEWLNVNERMVTLGHAWVMRRFYDHLPKDRQDKLNRLEGWARSKKVGLWRASDNIEPWKWRKSQLDA